MSTDLQRLYLETLGYRFELRGVFGAGAAAMPYGEVFAPDRQSLRVFVGWERMLSAAWRHLDNPEALPARRAA